MRYTFSLSFPNLFKEGNNMLNVGLYIVIAVGILIIGEGGMAEEEGLIIVSRILIFPFTDKKECYA
ncbi:MAG: hypothetical protein Q7T83_02930 [Thermodesulfovibrionales bacterium]|nr:hypothetical protein [Thermodesulfovibrionales bacterium]